MLLDVRAVEKSFPGVKALDGVSLQVASGEVHALLGENGAGKSTLLKILSGAQAQDRGELVFDGVPLDRTDTPLKRQEAGIVTIYQEFNLVPEMSVAENMFLGREPCRYGLVDWGAMRRRAEQVLSDLGLSMNPDAPVRGLSIAEQQMVEIAKAMTFKARLIIMDEPTAALSGREVEALHRIIRDLRGRGVSVIYVTHRLAEVQTICDRFTVLRDGRFITDGEVGDREVADLVRAMVGRDVEFAPRERTSHGGELVLRVEGVRRACAAANLQAKALHDMSLDLHAGEILGFAGLVGAGRTELARIIFGADRCEGGVMWLHDGHVGLLRSPGEAIRHGVALAPEDRKRQGCFLDQSVKHNMSLPSLSRLSRWGVFIDEAAEDALVDRYRQALHIRTPSHDTPIGKLSGGNQQKVLLARCMALAPKVLIVDEPTRGIDVGAKVEVHQVLADMASQGVAVIVISSELPEILALSDRIAVFREGCITGVVEAAGADEEMLMRLMAMDDPTAPSAVRTAA